MKKYTIFLILISASLFFNSCKYDFILPEEVPVIEPGGDPISFESQIAPIFSTGNKCTACHKTGGFASPDLSNSATVYSQIVPKYVDLASPASSKIYTYSTSGTHNNLKVSATQSVLLLQWIKEGAKNN